MVRASVCMAAYNGELFVEEQMNSILSQLGEMDEVIVVDDRSTDHTPLLMKQYLSDSRVKFYQNPRNLGVCKTFETAIRKASGKYIVLSDQDDIWTPGRHEKMVEALETGNSMLVTGNFKVIKDGVVSDFPVNVDAKTSRQHVRNILRIFNGGNGYFGCVMAFNQKLNSLLLPFPAQTESHDLWMAIVANLLRSNRHMDEIVLLRKLHGNNASTVQRSYFRKIKSRVVHLTEIAVFVTRLFRHKFFSKSLS